MGRKDETTVFSASTFCEPLSVQDEMFLLCEGPNVHMHVSATLLFDGSSLITPDGGIDVGRIRSCVGSRLDALPRLRQRLHRAPVTGRHSWVDDGRFNLEYHVRHTSLPRPGTDDQLRSLCGRIMSQKLDRGKPLWEIWVVEGLPNSRFALVVKAHHAMVDGVGGLHILWMLLRPFADATVGKAATWKPKPAPGVLGYLESRARQSVANLERMASAWREPVQTTTNLIAEGASVFELLAAGVRGAPKTPFNRPIGPHRRFEWLEMDLGEIKRIKKALDCTVNDVVLSVVAGALRRQLRQASPRTGIEEVRALVPVSLRTQADAAALGNRISAWLVPLPVGTADPVERVRCLHEATARLKASRIAAGGQFLTNTGVTLTALGMRLMEWVRPFNLVVTNVPGPQDTLYLLDAPLLAIFPQVPLFSGQGLGVALFSYAGKLCWGFNTDRDAVRDPGAVVKAVRETFVELRGAIQEKHKVVGLRRVYPARGSRLRASGSNARRHHRRAI